MAGAGGWFDPTSTTGARDCQRFMVLSLLCLVKMCSSHVSSSSWVMVMTWDSWSCGVSTLSNVCDRGSLPRSLRYFARVGLVSLEDGELSFVSRRESHRVDLLSGHVS